MTIPVTIFILDELKGQVAKSDLIRSEGTLELVVSPELAKPSTSGIFFGLECTGYKFQVGIQNGRLYVGRGPDFVDIALSSAVSEGDTRVVLHAMWSPTELFVSVGTTTKFVIDKKPTSPVFPPNSLIEWARKESVIPAHTYKSHNDIWETTAGLLLSIQDKVNALAMRNPFWNVQYDGSRIAKERDRCPANDSRVTFRSSFSEKLSHHAGVSHFRGIA